MSIITSVGAQASTPKLTQILQSADNSLFESVLGSFGASPKANSSFSFLEISSSMVELITGFEAVGFGNAVDFPFTPSFVSTFGTSGPLPVFIAATVANLKLNAQQQTALQDIAVANKDITKTPENVQKISMQLQTAGIGYASTT
jgi:hypothetical protein